MCQTLSYTCAHSAPHWTLTNGLSVWDRKQVSPGVKFALGQVKGPGGLRVLQMTLWARHWGQWRYSPLNTFSLEIMTPQTLQTHRSFWPWKPPRALYYVARGGEWWLGPGLYPSTEIPTHKLAAFLQLQPPLPTPTLGATSALLCGDRSRVWCWHSQAT